MAVVNPLQQAFALLLIFFLPGFLLLKAALPRHRFGARFHVPAVLFLSVTLSVAFTVLAGGALAFLPAPNDAPGFFQGAATGGPLIEIALGGGALLLAGIAWRRGAFPRLGRTGSDPAPPADTGEEADRFPGMVRLRAEELRLTRELRSEGGSARAEEIRRALAEVRARAREIEDAATRERYG